MPSRPGKYAHLIGKIPKTFGTEPDYQEKIDVRKQQILDFDAPGGPRNHESVLRQVCDLHEILNDLMVEAAGGKRHSAALASAYKTARIAKDELEKREKDLNLTLIALEQLIADQYEVEGTTSIKLADGAVVRTQIEPHAQVEEREVYRLWCIKNGYETMMSLPWQTTNGLVKEMLLKGENEPPGVKAFMKTKIFFQK